MSKARTADAKTKFKMLLNSSGSGVNTSAMNFAIETNVIMREMKEKATLTASHL